MSADSQEHHVSVGELPAVKDNQVLPNHSRWAPRCVPPSRPCPPDQLVLGQPVEAVLLQRLPHLLLPLLQPHRWTLMVFQVLVVVNKELGRLGELLLKRHMLVGPLS